MRDLEPIHARALKEVRELSRPWYVENKPEAYARQRVHARMAEYPEPVPATLRRHGLVRTVTVYDLGDTIDGLSGFGNRLLDSILASGIDG